VLAVAGTRPTGVVTKLDLLEYLAHRGAGARGVDGRSLTRDRAGGA
jgi:hypothetical protein